MKSSILGRSFVLAKMLARLGLKEARSGQLESRIQQAAILFESLAQLKGAAMKAGQLLSLELVDYFPKEAVDVLSRLQNSAHTLDYSLIESVLRQELGDENLNKIVSIDRKPVGSASIGQVHRARYADREIVLKVQLPGVAESIDSDLRILNAVASAFCSLTGREMDLRPLFEEFRAMLVQEVDFLNEAKLQTAYRERVIGLNDVSGLVYRVPEVVSELSSRRVLAMDWEPGVPLRSWIQGRPSQALRERIAHGLLNLYFYEFFAWGMVQTDPNQANFLVSETHEATELILLDFGATRRYQRQFVRQYVQLLEATARGDRQQLGDEAVAFGLIDPRESKEAFDALYDVLTVAVRPFFISRGGSLSPELFDFSDESHARRSQETTRVLAQKLKYSPPPRDLIFLHRKLGGIYAALKSLGVILDVSQYWRRMIEADL